MKKVPRAFHSKKSTGPFFVFLVCFFTLIIPAVLTAETLHSNLLAGDYRLVKTDTGGSSIEMTTPGYSRLNSPGDPVLPEKIIELKVPQDGMLSNLKLTVDGAAVAALPQTYDIVPGSPFMTDKNEYWGVGKSIVKGKNMYVYGKNAFFPGNTIELLPSVMKKEIASQDGQKRSYRLVRYIRIAFRPFAYNPVSRQLKFTQTASVTVTYDVAAAGKVSQSMASPTAVGADYVIITTKEIVSESGMLQSFAKMKQAAGHTVKIVTEDDYGSLTGQAPNGTAEKIRQWLMDNYMTMGIDYVLLIGDPAPADPLKTSRVGAVPMKMCYPQLCDRADQEGPTDFFYADLVGNWDLDGDGIFGENLPVDRPQSPSPAVGPGVFSAVWTGKIQFDVSSGYYLCPFSSDGVRVYLDGNPTPLYDNWTEHAPLYRESDYFTTTAGLHDIKVEYYKKSANGVMQLFWYSFDCGLERAVIPADHLYHYDAASGTYVSGGLDATYYNSIDLSGPAAYTDVRIVNDVWMTGDNGENGRQPQAQVSVGRIPVYYHDYYSLDLILAKIIAYETDPGDLSWRTSVLLPTFPLDAATPGYPLGEAVKGNVTDPLGYKSFRIYNQDYAPSGPTPELWPCNPDNVVGEWLNHYGMVTWFTHGNSSAAAGIIGVSDVENLDDGYPSFTFQASCTTGFPESSENLGYSLLKHGAVATVSASRSPLYAIGSTNVTDPASTMCEDAAYFYTYYVMSNGGAPLAAGDALNEYRKHLPSMGREVIVFNLYGDPDCRLFTTMPHVRPVAMLSGPYSCNEGQNVTLNASGSYDPGGGPLQYRWDLDGDGKYDTAVSTSPTCTAKFNQFTIVSVQVQDEIGVTAWTSASVVVTNLPPVVDAGPNQTATVNTTVFFSGTATDPGDDIDTIEWNYGDGSPIDYGTLTPIGHTFTTTGTFTVTLKVTDRLAVSTTDTLKVKVVGVSPLSNENPARPWTKKQGNFTLANDTTLKSEGTLSLKLNGTGYMVVNTPVFAASEIASYSSQLSLDIYMSSPATNPGWLGQVQVFVTCPSAGINNQIAGQVELTGLALDKWDTLNFTLAQKFVNLFKGTAKDIQLSIVVNTNQAASKPYRIDNLRFTGTLIAK
jgi:hypothetical protein